MSRSPFIFDSKTENYKDPSASVGVKSVSRDSGSTALEYFDEAGNKLPIKDTLVPVSHTFNSNHNTEYADLYNKLTPQSEKMRV